VIQVVLAHFLVEGQLQLTDSFFDFNFDDDVLGLHFAEPIAHFNHLILVLKTYVVHSLNGLLDVVERLKHYLSSEEVTHLELGLPLSLFPSSDDIRDFLRPVLADHVHHIDDSELMITFGSLRGDLDAGVNFTNHLVYFGLCHLLLEHFFENSKKHLELMPFIFGQLHADTEEITIAFLSHKVNQCFELRIGLLSLFVNCKYLSEDLLVVVEEFMVLEEIDLLFFWRFEMLHLQNYILPAVHFRLIFVTWLHYCHLLQLFGRPF
jgi:hypothetical protein